MLGAGGVGGALQPSLLSKPGSGQREGSGMMQWISAAFEVAMSSSLFFLDSCNFSRCKVDIAALPLKQANCLELPLDSCLGALLMLITLTPCTGVSVSDLCVCPLADPSERKQIDQRYVSASPVSPFPPPPAPTFKLEQSLWLKNCVKRDLCPKFNGMSHKTRHQT